MRPSHTRSSWPVWSMLGAALALLTVSLAGSEALEGSCLVRLGRHAQRLDAVDGLPHSHEQAEPDPAPAGLVVLDATDGGGPAGGTLDRIHAAPPGDSWNGRATRRESTSRLVWPIHLPVLAGAPPGAGIRFARHDVHPHSARLVRPALGRAPPAA